MRKPEPRQIVRTARTRVADRIKAIGGWWREVNSDRDYRINLIFLAASALLTVGTVAAFLWIAGVLDWRGSDGSTHLNFAFQCQGKDRTPEWDDCWRSLDNANKFEAMLNLAPQYGRSDTLDVNLGFETIQKELMPVLAKGMGLQIISDRAFDVSPKGEVNHYDGSWYSTLLQPAMPTTLAFVRNSLVHYTGLSEREVMISLNFMQSGSVLHGERTLAVSIVPPDGFDVVEASPPADRDGSGRYWTMQLKSDNGDFVFRVRMRNFEAARLDHILDSSIAALLGVAAGGVMTACLALALLRRRRKA